MEQNNFEVIHYPKIRHITSFLITIRFRSFHVHNELELFTVLDGSATIQLKDRCVSVEKGDVLLFNPGQAHEINAGEGSVTALVTQVSSRFCEEYFREIVNSEFMDNAVQKYIHKDDYEKLVASLCQVASAYIQETRLFEMFVTAEICKILFCLYQNVPTRDYRTSEAKSMRQMNEIAQYIDANFSEKIALKDMASMIGVSPSRFSHIFTNKFGISFQEYLHELRFEKAMRLIPSRNLSLTTIAQMSGFSDGKYMNRMFLKHLGCTPREYRGNLYPTYHPQEIRNTYLQNFHDNERSLEILQKYESEK